MSHAHFRFVLAVLMVAGAVSPEVLRAADATSLDASAESITVKELQQHVNVLASDTFEGREAGSRGGIAAAAYLVDALKKMDVSPGGTSSYFQFFGADYRNILAVVHGSDPELKDEYVVISSHYDHVGFGSARNSYGPIGRIHNGADDNGSGTAALLEIIEAIQSVAPAPRRSILFAFWDAEEKGLLGSEHWVAHPTVPLKQVKLMINADMIGRLRSNSLEIYGVRTAPGLRRLICEQNRPTELALDFNWNNVRDSDHYPFYARQIPYLMFHTRKHENYHRPSDDVDTLNMEGMQKVSRLMFRTLHAAANAEELSSFRSEARLENSATRSRNLRTAAAKPPRLGITWSKEFAEEGVIRIVRVTPDSAAQRGGLKIGDTVLKFDGREVKSAADFHLIVLAADNPATVVVQREGESQPVERQLTLAGMPERIGVSFAEDEAEPGIIRLTRVTPGSAAANAKLQPNHRIYAVGGRRFSSGAEFQQLVEKLPGPVKLLVEGQGLMAETELNLLPSPKPATETAAAEE